MKSLLALLILFITTNVRAETCAQFMIESSALEQTQAYLAYLENLVDQNLLALAQIDALAIEPRTNPFVDSGRLAERIHARELELFLRQAELDFDKIKDWSVRTARTLRGEDRKRDQASLATRVISGLGTMNRVEDFEMMATPVTEELWIAEWDQNTGERRKLRRPVVNVSFASVAEFANRISMRAGLEPYYVSPNWVNRGEAERGNLVLIGSPIKTTGSNGYRVPTKQEYERVVTLAANFNGDHVEDFAWTFASGPHRPQVIRGKKALLVDGQEFYDVLGNVYEYTGQFSYFDLGLEKVEKRVFRRDLGYNKLGFRLARSRK